MPGSVRGARQVRGELPGALEKVAEPAPWEGVSGCCDTSSRPHIPLCPSARSSFLECCVRLPPGEGGVCSGCGRRVLQAGSSSWLPAAAPQGRGVQATVAVTQGPGTCCGASAGKPELLLQPCAAPHDILQPRLSRIPLLPGGCLHPRVWTGRGRHFSVAPAPLRPPDVGAAPLRSHVSC